MTSDKKKIEEQCLKVGFFAGNWSVEILSDRNLLDSEAHGQKIAQNIVNVSRVWVNTLFAHSNANWTLM